MDAYDIAQAQDIIAAAERADGHRPMSDHLWLDLAEGGRPGFAGLVAWEFGHDHPVAYCQVSRGNTSWAIELVVHPHHRYDMAVIGPELIEAALNVIAGEGGGHVNWWVFEPTPMHYELGMRFNLAPTRKLYQLRCHLPLPAEVIAATNPITTEAFVPGRDDSQWLAANNAAFVEHPEQGNWDLGTLKSRQNQPWFNAAGFRIYCANGKIKGFCWTKEHRDVTPAMGEIYVIGVVPGEGGKGLGRSLTVDGLQHIHACGINIGMLYVDSDNEPARRLYKSLGFEIHRTDVAFTGDI